MLYLCNGSFVTVSVIQKGLKQLNCCTSYDFDVTVTSFPFPIQRAVRITESGGLAVREPESISMRSQDLAEMYHDAGQIYLGVSGCIH